MQVARWTRTNRTCTCATLRRPRRSLRRMVPRSAISPLKARTNCGLRFRSTTLHGGTGERTMRDFLHDYGTMLLIVAAVILFSVAAVKYGPAMIERFTIASQSHHASI